MLVYAPGKKGKEVKFYLNGTILLNASDTIKYNPGDVRFVKLYYNIDTEKLEVLKEIVVLEEEENISDIINNIKNISINNITENLKIVNISLEIKLEDSKVEDRVIIPINNPLSTKDLIGMIENLTKTLKIAESIKNETIMIKNESHIEKVVEKIAKNITPVLAQNFTIANKTSYNTTTKNSTVISTISFKAENTSQKGFVTVRIPIGNLTVKNVTVSNGTTTVTLLEDNIGNKTGWYRIPIEGILEITLIKDPDVKVVLSTVLPPKKTTTEGGKTTHYTSSGGGPSPITKIVAKDIESEKIRYFVYRAKLIVGSEIDVNLSAKYLKTIIDLTDRSLEIKEDCILIGGPVANPTVKKYLAYFPVEVSNEYPGKNRGVIEKTAINGHTVILLAGSDRWGTKAAVEYFKTLEDLPDEPIFVEWRNGVVVKIGRP